MSTENQTRGTGTRNSFKASQIALVFIGMETG